MSVENDEKHTCCRVCNDNLLAQNYIGRLRELVKTVPQFDEPAIRFVSARLAYLSCRQQGDVATVSVDHVGRIVRIRVHDSSPASLLRLLQRNCTTDGIVVE